jgi:hypothetical protein
MAMMTREQFDVMQDSYNKGSIGYPDTVGISVANWRLQNLMAATKWALDHGYEFPEQAKNVS